MARAHAHVRPPTAVLALGSAALPGRAAIDPPVDVRGLAWHRMDNPQARDESYGAGVALLRGPTAGVRRRLALLAPRGMRPFVDPKERG